MDIFYQVLIFVYLEAGYKQVVSDTYLSDMLFETILFILVLTTGNKIVLVEFKHLAFCFVY